KVAVVSLGCAKNLVDSEVMLGLLERDGCELVDQAEEAEVIIVNTCAFTAEAKTEALDAILETAQLKQEGKCRALLCCGCLSQRYAEELLEQLPEVDGFVGTGSVARIGSAVQAALRGERPLLLDPPSFLYADDTPRVRSGPQWLAYVKIAEGCDNPCSFCAIPAARGPFRSRRADSVRREFERLAEEGAREIILVAQDTTYYGMDLVGRPLLAELLGELDATGFDGWIRVLYMHPHRVDDVLVDVVAASRSVVPYFDIPMQHASARLLEAMERPERAEENLALIRRLRARVPGAAVRTAFVVGFPGETEADFAELLRFVEEAQIDRVSGFVFSAEEGTPAATMDRQIPREVAEERLAELMATQEPVSLRRNQALIGGQLEVLVEADHPEGIVGRTHRDAPEVDGDIVVADCVAPPGNFVRAVVTGAEVHDLRGVRVPDVLGAPTAQRWSRAVRMAG
ncbi:MAG: 30S ribosomal protein S12 methylthiotransferase RimO, partial [Armatimonadota bacterium]